MAGPGAAAAAHAANARPAGLPIRDRCLVMGVVNVTPDSFSDGGLWFDERAATRHGLKLAAQGADIVDVGGESTRPGAHRVPAAEEVRRVIPVVSSLARSGLVVSVDTMRAEVAERALAAGAAMVNDVSGGRADPAMTAVVASAGVPYVVVHWRGHSDDMYGQAEYQDIVGEVRGELAQRVRVAIQGGITAERIVIDPGLGFAKRPAHSWALLARLAEVGRIDVPGAPFPVLVGASRKGFVDGALAGPGGMSRPFTGRDDATVALTALAATAGAWCVRVHAVPGNVDAVVVASRLAAERARVPAAGARRQP